MEARVKFRKDTLHQTGSIGKFLLWLQEDSKRAKNTNIAQLAKRYTLSKGGSESSTKQMIQKMVNVQMLNRYGGKKRANFYINYLQKDIPGYILDNAPDEDKSRVQLIKDSIKQDQYIDADGCVVTEGNKEQEDKPAESDLETSETEEESKSSSDASEENIASVPVEIRETKDGLSISITLNININK